jgi:hypothetical protein
MVEYLSKCSKQLFLEGKMTIHNERMLYSPHFPKESPHDRTQLQINLHTNHYTKKELEQEAVCRL